MLEEVAQPDLRNCTTNEIPDLSAGLLMCGTFFKFAFRRFQLNAKDVTAIPRSVDRLDRLYGAWKSIVDKIDLLHWQWGFLKKRWELRNCSCLCFKKMTLLLKGTKVAFSTIKATCITKKLIQVLQQKLLKECCDPDCSSPDEEYINE